MPSSLVPVSVPEGAKPGDVVTVQVKGRKSEVVVPVTAVPGSTIYVKGPPSEDHLTGPDLVGQWELNLKTAPSEADLQETTLDIRLKDGRLEIVLKMVYRYCCCFNGTHKSEGYLNRMYENEFSGEVSTIASSLHQNQQTTISVRVESDGSLTMSSTDEDNYALQKLMRFKQLQFRRAGFKP